MKKILTAITFFVLSASITFAGSEAIQIDALWAGINNPTNGKSYSGAIVATFAAGTSTPKAVWTNKEKTLPSALGQAQFTLDSNGQAFVFGDGKYKISVYAPTDTGLTNPLITIDGTTYILPGDTSGISLSGIYDCDLVTAVANIGSVDQTTLIVDCDVIIPDGTTVTITDNISLNIINGGSIDGVAGGGTENITFNGLDPIAGKYKIFGDNLTVSGIIGRSYYEWFGALRDGITNDGPAMNRALSAGGMVEPQIGTYVIKEQLVLGSNNTGIVGNGSYSSIIDKQFNGNAILCDTNGAVFKNFDIEGNGATYTGGGIVPRGYNILIQHVRINGTEDSPILVAGAIGSNALAATYLRVDSCFLLPYDVSNVYKIRSISADDSDRPTARVFTNLSGGGNLVDFSGMNYATLSDSLGSLIKFDANCSKIVLKGNRFTNSSENITVIGNGHIITGNLFGFGPGYELIIADGVQAMTFGPTNLIDDGSLDADISILQSIGTAQTNSLFTKAKAYTPEWKGSILDPTIGNGSITGSYILSGRVCTANIYLLMGSTTSGAQGIWSFTLPWKRETGAISWGSCVIKDAFTGLYSSATAEVIDGEVFIYETGATGALNWADMTITAGSFIRITVTYIIGYT